MAVTRAVGVPVVAGDGADALAAVLDTVPPDLLAVVTESYTAVFLDAAERQAIAGVVADAGRVGVDLPRSSSSPSVPLRSTACTTFRSTWN